jgi:hypothetical protein
MAVAVCAGAAAAAAADEAPPGPVASPALLKGSPGPDAVARITAQHAQQSDGPAGGRDSAVVLVCYDRGCRTLSNAICWCLQFCCTEHALPSHV